MHTPVVFIIFNRPEEASLVFAEIRKARPKKLFVIADGPRTPEEQSRCDATRSIIDSIDWPCELFKNFSDFNLGCGKRISSGLDWVFSQVEEAIVLEDDCIPDQTFFPFCEEMLERYRNNTRVMHIAGTSMQEGNSRFNPKDSYYFSIIPNLWGWATWKRAWKLYDFDMKVWPKAKKEGSLIQWFANPAAYERFSGVFDRYYKHEENNWDNQWVFACALNRALCINPTLNLITNIGFNDSGTHFKGVKTPGDKMRHSITFPLLHPNIIAPDRSADSFKYRDTWGIDKKLHHRMLRPIKTLFPDLYWKFRNFFKLR
jgi:hypothetical protein